MNKDDEINAIELELQGLDIELRNKRLLHQSLVATIAYLENSRLQLLHKLMQLKNPLEQ